jgi:hypothetical protein
MQKHSQVRSRLLASASTIGFDGLGRPVPNAAATFTIQNAVVPANLIAPLLLSRTLAMFGNKPI